MSINNKPYEISLWKDVIDTTNSTTSEVKICVLGGDSCRSAISAFDPKLTLNVNGTHSLSFSMYYKYWNNDTSTLEDNPFNTYLTNEQKVKLCLDSNQTVSMCTIPRGRILGDASYDGTLTKYDATQVLRYAAGLDPMTAEDFLASDVNKDGYVNASDAARIQWEIAGSHTIPYNDILNNWTYDESLKLYKYVYTNSAILATYLVYTDYTFDNIVVNTGQITFYASILPTTDIQARITVGHEWYDFIIKDIQEDSEKYIFTYTCEDLFIEELSKNGYSIELDEQLGNNTGTTKELANYILEGSDWQVGDYTEIRQLTNEALFIYSLASGTTITANILDSPIVTTATTIEITGPVTLYPFYSDVVNNSDPVQFLYVQGGDPQTDSKSVITNAYQCSIARSSLSGLSIACGVSTQYRGEKLVKTQKGQFVPILDRYCQLYLNSTDSKEYYGYCDYEYASASNIKELISNNLSFLTDSWTSDGTIEIINNVTTSERYSTLKITNGTYIINNGLSNLRSVFTNGLIKDDKLILLTRGNNITKAEIILEWEDSTTHTYTAASQGEVEIESIKYYYWLFTFDSSYTYNELINAERCDVKLTLNGDSTFRDIKLFKYNIGKDSKIIIPDLTKAEQSVTKVVYKFAKKEDVDKLVVDGDVKYSITSTDALPTGYSIIYYDNYEKVSSITASKSNRFNLLQEVAEQFKCWCRFDIQHETNGSIRRDFAKTTDIYYIGGKRYYKLSDNNYILITSADRTNLFTDLTSTSTYDATAYYYYKDFSGSAATKDYYLSALTEEDFNYIIEQKTYGNYAKLTGWTQQFYEYKSYKYVSYYESIGQANYAGFRYGINLNSITRTVNSDSVVTKLIVEQNSNEYSDNDAKFCSITNSSLNPIKENFILNFDYYVNKGILDKDDLHNDLYGSVDDTGLAYITKLALLNKDNSALITEQALVYETQMVAKANLDTANTNKTEATNLKAQYAQYLLDHTIAKDSTTEPYWNTTTSQTSSEKEASWRQQYNYYYDKEQYYSDQVTNYYTPTYQTISNQYNALTLKLTELTTRKSGLNNAFYSKYSRYLREGTWIDESYMSADKYYLDGLSVSANSAFPQISYSINVTELSGIEEYDAYQYEVGDTTYIEDTEFFGWCTDGSKRPYQEKVIVSEIVYELDDPSKTTITIKNYENRWESLFQRVAAATESLQFSEGGYAKVANTINTDGTIKSDYLKSAFAQNQILANALNLEIANGQGLQLINPTNPAKEIRLGSEGIVLKNGSEWTTAISADGINATKINTGQLNTELIKIYKGSNASFIWDSDGLNAYAVDDTTIDPNKYVRFDQNGIVGIQNGQTITPVFSLTYNGFELNAADGTGSVKIDSKVDKVIRVLDSTKTDTFYVEKDGDVFLKGTINATGGYFGGVKIEDNAMKIYSSASAASSGSYPYTEINNNSISLYQDANNKVVIADNTVTITGGTATSQNGITIDKDGITFVGYDPDIADKLKKEYGIVSKSSSTIGASYIYSPQLIAHEIDIVGEQGTADDGGTLTFNYYSSSSATTTTRAGWMGFATGAKEVMGTSVTTYGVGLTCDTSNSAITTSTAAPYLLCTTAGIRMVGGGLSVGGGIGVWDNKAWFKQEGGDWQEIGSGTAVFG